MNENQENSNNSKNVPKPPPRLNSSNVYAEINKRSLSFPIKKNLKKILLTLRIVYFTIHLSFSLLMMTFGIYRDHFPFLVMGVLSSISLLGMFLFFGLKGRNHQPRKPLNYSYRFEGVPNYFLHREDIQCPFEVGPKAVYSEPELEQYGNLNAKSLTNHSGTSDELIETTNFGQDSCCLSTIGPLPNIEPVKIHKHHRHFQQLPRSLSQPHSHSQGDREDFRNLNLESYLLRNGLFHLMKSSMNINHDSRRLHNWQKFNHHESHLWSKPFEENIER